MNAYHHLLVAIDDTDEHQLLIKKSLELTRRYQAKLSVLHVLDNIPMPDTPYGTRINLDEPSDYPLLEHEKRQLAKLADAMKIPHNSCWLVWGSPNQEIVTLADQESVDLIILGSHPKSALASLLGSTTDSVLHHANCDILAVSLIGKL